MSDATRKTVYIIDGHAQIFRAYHAIRSLSSPVTKEPTNATFGFVGMLLKLFSQCRPDYVIVTIDVSGDRESFRSELYPPYKATRGETPDDLPPQTQRIVEICRLWGIPVLGVEGVEADDVIATLCERLRTRDDLRIRIVSRDKDLEQLIGEHVDMYDVHTDETVNLETLRREKGLTPQQVVDALTLMGDKVDNIPGVPGIGPKTAAKLISQYGSLDALLAHTDELSGKLKEGVESMRELFPVTRKLVELRRDVPIDFELEQAKVGPTPVEPLRHMFKQLGFTRHLNDLMNLAGETASAPPPEAPAAESSSTPKPSQPARRESAEQGGGLFDNLEDDHALTTTHGSADPSCYTAIVTAEQLNEVAETIREHVAAGQPVAVDTETDRLNPIDAKLCGVCLSWQAKQGVYIPVRSNDATRHLNEAAVMARLRPILEDPAVGKVGHNLKYDMLVLRGIGESAGGGVTLKGPLFDTMIASYLIDPTRSSHKMDNLALAHLEYEPIPITDLIGRGRKQRSMIDLPYEAVTVYAGEDADVTYRLYEHFAPRLDELGLRQLFDDLEMPLVEVLAELEYNGILVDPDELQRQKRELDQRIGELHGRILEAAGGEPFNPDSTKQLADVLFKRLKCKVVRRGKTGPSTDSEVLQRIADEQPPPGSVVAELVLEYRMLTKLRSTYMDSLTEAINPRTRRIHASFNQTVTATGRLSSSEPNLQNIPIRTELGRQIRKAFIAPPGHVLLAADYSQIELRLLAHLSQDAGLIEAFASDLDIHAAVAAQVFNVMIDQVSNEQRSTAKMVNFGIVYGITPYGLARRLPADAAGSSVEVAKKIIADYKTRYPKIDQFLHECVSTAETLGYVQTICGRRRPVPEVHSNNPNVAGFGRRIAINTVVQGSAADLIKMAMVRLHRRIRDERLPMKMLLQIHDELVFETPADQAERMAEIVREEMVGAMRLSVPLKVDAAWGPNWFEAK